MANIVLYSWGYWGWGNETKTFVDALDAVEQSKGFDSPFFVDIRFHRDVRSKGFRNDAFEKLVGAGRYRWMKSLGNAAISGGSGKIRIVDPCSADQLFDLAKVMSDRNQRIIFFCACATPMLDGYVFCHRHEVGSLLLKAARKKGESVQIVEWPGGEPVELEIDLQPKEFDSVIRGRVRRFSVETRRRDDLTSVAGLPWCSIVNLYCEGAPQELQLPVISGPGTHSKRGWKLPIICCDPYLDRRQLREKSHQIRLASGLLPRTVLEL